MPRAALPRYQEGNPATDILAQRPRADSAEAAGAFAVVGGRPIAKTHLRTRQGQCGAFPTHFRQPLPGRDLASPGWPVARRRPPGWTVSVLGRSWFGLLRCPVCGLTHARTIETFEQRRPRRSHLRGVGGWGCRQVGQ